MSEKKYWLAVPWKDPALKKKTDMKRRILHERGTRVERRERDTQLEQAARERWSHIPTCGIFKFVPITSGASPNPASHVTDRGEICLKRVCWI